MPGSIRRNQAACLEPPKLRENDHRANTSNTTTTTVDRIATPTTGD